MRAIRTRLASKCSRSCSWVSPCLDGLTCSDYAVQPGRAVSVPLPHFGHGISHRRRRGKKWRAAGRRSLHHSLVTAVPELRNDGIILNAHNDSEIAAHLAGEDEETARRFGWWPAYSTEETVRAAYANWARNWQEDGPVRAFAARDPGSGALVGNCELRIGPDGTGEVSYWTHAWQAGPGVRAQRPGPARRRRGLDRRHPPGSARRPRQPRLTARRRSRRLHPGGHHHRRRRNRIHPLHTRCQPSWACLMR